jgi:hypothetical protein
MSFLFKTTSSTEPSLEKDYCRWLDLNDEDYAARILRIRADEYPTAQFEARPPHQPINTNSLKRNYSSYLGETLFENEAASLKSLYDQLCRKIESLENREPFSAIDDDFFSTNLDSKTMAYIDNCFYKVRSLVSSLHEFNYKDARFPVDQLTELLNLVITLKNSKFRENRRVQHLLSMLDSITEVEKAYTSLKAMEAQIKASSIISGLYSFVWNRNFSVYSSSDLNSLPSRVSIPAPRAPETQRPLVLDQSAIRSDHFSLSSSTANSTQSGDIRSSTNASMTAGISVSSVTPPKRPPRPPRPPRPHVVNKLHAEPSTPLSLSSSTATSTHLRDISSSKEVSVLSPSDSSDLISRSVSIQAPRAPLSARPVILVLSALHSDYFSSSAGNSTQSGDKSSSKGASVSIPICVTSVASTHTERASVGPISTSNLSSENIPPPPPLPDISDLHSSQAPRALDQGSSHQPSKKGSKSAHSHHASMFVLSKTDLNPSRLKKASKESKKDEEQKRPEATAKSQFSFDKTRELFNSRVQGRRQATKDSDSEKDDSDFDSDND